MTEFSLPWAGTVDIDAGPYTDDDWSDWMRKYFTGDRDFQGVVPGYTNGLVATGVASPVAVQAGAAIVDGKYYESTATENVVVPTPAGATRIDVIVLRKTWASQQVRLTRIAGVEGAGVPPAITQVDGVTWDIPLWQASITVGGVITLTDRRHLAKASLAQFPLVQGRLTLTSGTPVTTSDVTGATTIYFTPYHGNRITLWNSLYGGWVEYNFAELALTVPNTTNQMYDVFIYDAGEGVLTLQAVAWTNDTTRNIALTGQDGMQVKSTDDRLYLGSFRTTGVAGETESSNAKRYIWNYFNREPLKLKVIEATNSWAYATAAWRQANNTATNQVEVVIGINEVMVHLTAEALCTSYNFPNLAAIGIALDATNTTNADIWQGMLAASSQYHPVTAKYDNYVGVGYHYLAWTEYGSTNVTFYGDNGGSLTQSGMLGHVMG